MAEEMMENPAPRGAVRNNWILPASIIIAAVIIGGSLIYLVRGGGPSSTNYPTNAFSKCIDSKKYAEVANGDYTAATDMGINSTPTVFVNGAMVTTTARDQSGKVILDQSGQPMTVGAGANGQLIFQAIELALANPLKNPVAGPLALDSRDVALGRADAPVTVIEYGDYQCPACGYFFRQIEPALQSQYIGTGKVKFVFRNFPFLGQESFAAAAAAECAKDQGKFWEYHNALYAAEDLDNRENNGNMDRNFFLKIAQDLKLSAK